MENNKTLKEIAESKIIPCVTPTVPIKPIKPIQPSEKK